jgi:hypothetical protein
VCPGRDTLPNDELGFGMSVSFEGIDGFLKWRRIDTTQSLLERLDAINEFVG